MTKVTIVFRELGANKISFDMVIDAKRETRGEANCALMVQQLVKKAMGNIIKNTGNGFMKDIPREDWE